MQYRKNSEVSSFSKEKTDILNYIKMRSSVHQVIYSFKKCSTVEEKIFSIHMQNTECLQKLFQINETEN